MCLSRPWKPEQCSLNVVCFQTCDVSSLAPHTGSDVHMCPFSLCSRLSEGSQGRGSAPVTCMQLPEKGEGREERAGEGREGLEGWGMTRARPPYASPRGQAQVEPLCGSHRTSSRTPGPICRARNFLPLLPPRIPASGHRMSTAVGLSTTVRGRRTHWSDSSRRRDSQALPD